MPVSPEPPLFSAILTPHRSLGPAGFRLVMAMIGGTSLAVGAVFCAVGAWPVSGLFGLHVLLVYWAFRASYGAARAFEEVLVTASELRVRKVSRGGRVSEWTLNPLWVRLVCVGDEEYGMQRLLLVSRGRALPIGGFLPPQEKESFAAALGQAIREAKRGPTRTTFTVPK